MRLISFLFAGLLMLIQPTFAQSADEAYKALATGGFSERASAIETLASSGHPKALIILKALSDGNLQSTDAGALVIDGKDALTGEVVSDSAAAIPMNNRVRGVLRGAMGRLALFDSDPAARTSAIEGIQANPTPDSIPLLRTALAAETVPAIKSLLESTLAVVELNDPDPARRTAAVKNLSEQASPRAQGLLRTRLSAEENPQVKAAIESALASIDTRLGFVYFALNLFQGLSLGSVLLLAACGLAITFGVMGVINMAHGEMIMIGAYTTYVVQQVFRTYLPPSFLDWYLPVAVPAAFLVAGAIGIAIERGIIRFLYGRALETLLATWGVSLMLQQAVRTIFGAPNKEVANPTWMTGGMEIMAGQVLTWNRLVIILFAVAVVAGLAAIMRFSSIGLQMRAVTQNRPMASAMGIRTGRVDALTFGLGSGIAGIAGVALSQIGNVSPNLGQAYIVDSFMVVVFGGVGSLWGTIAGALSLGLVNKLLEPVAGAMLGKILVLVIIILFIQRRPRGLFALKGRSVES